MMDNAHLDISSTWVMEVTLKERILATVVGYLSKYTMNVNWSLLSEIIRSQTSGLFS